MAVLGNLIEQVRGVSYKPEDLHTTLNEDSIILLRANNIKDSKLNFDDVVDENVRYVYKLCLGLLHDQKIAHQITHQTFWEFYDYFVNVKENMMFEELANIALRLVKSYNIELEGKGR